MRIRYGKTINGVANLMCIQYPAPFISIFKSEMNQNLLLIDLKSDIK